MHLAFPIANTIEPILAILSISESWAIILGTLEVQVAPTPGAGPGSLTLMMMHADLELFTSPTPQEPRLNWSRLPITVFGALLTAFGRSRPHELLALFNKFWAPLKSFGLFGSYQQALGSFKWPSFSRPVSSRTDRNVSETRSVAADHPCFWKVYIKDGHNTCCQVNTASVSHPLHIPLDGCQPSVALPALLGQLPPLHPFLPFSGSLNGFGIFGSFR